MVNYALTFSENHLVQSPVISLEGESQAQLQRSKTAALGEGRHTPVVEGLGFIRQVGYVISSSGTQG